MSPTTAPEQTFAQARILVVGDLMLDRYWTGSVDRISPEAPVPVVHVQQQDDRLGGAANVARNVASLGGQAMLMGVVGVDDAGRRLRELVESSGIESWVLEDLNVHTTLKLRVLGRQQQLVRLDFESPPSADVLAHKSEVFGRALASADVVIFSDYGKGGLDQVPALIAQARAAGKPVLVDPKGDSYERYAGATLLTPNRSEFFQVVGKTQSEDELRARAFALRERLGLAHLLVTRSEEGMTLFSADEQVFHVPAQAREVFDVSGAGDTVIATLALALASGQPITEAVRLANRAGGIVVGKLGTATLSAAELFQKD